MEPRIPEEKILDCLRVKMDNDFETGKILTVSEETLQKYLWLLCTEGIDNERVRHRAVVRALTINHIQMQRHIDKLNKRSTVLQWVVIILTIATLFAIGYQIYRQETKTIASAQALPPNKPSVESLAPISKTSKEVLPSLPTPPQATPEISHQGNTTSPNTPSQLNPQGAAPSGTKEHGGPNK